MGTFMQDFRFAFRTIRRSPGFALSVIVALTLGIGANTTLFSVVKGILLSSLPYGNEDELVMIWQDATPRGGTNRVPVSVANYLDWKEANPAFTDVAALFNSSYRLSALDEPVVPLTHEVTASYFDVMGIEPHLGRTFRPEEAEPGGDKVAVVSYGLWQRILGGDPTLLGQSLLLDDESYTLIGVLKPDYLSVHIFATQPDLFVPLVLDEDARQMDSRTLAVYARMRAGVDVKQAQTAMQTVAERLAEQYPETNEGWDARVVPIREEAVGRVRPLLTVLLAAVGFVLLIACANVANMTLARSAERDQEIALRRALGASGWRLSRQLLSESVVLGLVGGTTGLLLAAWTLQPLLRLVPTGAPVPFLEKVTLDWEVLLFTLGLSVATGTLFGLAPSSRVSRMELNEHLKHGGRNPASSRSSRGFGAFLVVSEVTLALVLVAGAGLAIKGFRNLKGYDPGFDAERLLTVRTSLRGESFAEPHQRIRHFEELASRLRALPGVTSVSATSFTPPLFPFQASTFTIPGEAVEPGHEPGATIRAVLPDYFRTVGIPVLRGRPLGTEDRESSAPVVVINEVLARRYFAGRDALGESIELDSSPQPDLSPFMGSRRIVGIVGNVRTLGTNPEPLAVIYLPHRQAPVPIMNMMIRTDAEPSSLLKAAEHTAWGMGGDINVYGVETLADRIANAEWSSQVSTLLLGLFALLALSLGAAGIYAVISYTVAKRTRELGLRMALGARRGEVLRMVLASGLKLTAVGVVAGIAATWALARFLESLLYNVSTNDIVTFAGASLLLVGVAAAASAVPAYRASRVDPILTLRHD
ncbi:MAG TPA: ABC transporter permease [Vicinamibacteria bacterium]|nr:ABC transporter permease [Vicinamibacteria bacterium]